MKAEIFYILILITFLVLSYFYGEAFSRILLAILTASFFFIFFRHRKQAFKRKSNDL